VNFLVDEQLPPALADWIRAQGHEAVHVRDLGLASSPDATVWKTAAERSAVVLTKDEDFRHLWSRKSPAIPVIWIRVGNCTNRALVGWLSPLWPEMIRQLESGETMIEVSR
jgi:predicted nuclease of predicted toxin-antitoxin system